MVYLASEVTTAIESVKNSKAARPNDLSLLLMKHLRPIAIDFLRRLINLPFSKLQMPLYGK